MNAQQLVALVKTKLGQRYILGARVPLNDRNWNGPWDCAEFVSWGTYQATGEIIGTSNNNGDPAKTDPYTGYWERDVKNGTVNHVTIAEAASIAGAILLRSPKTNASGHIVFSDGAGGTIEAHSHVDGVVRLQISGRRWDYGIIVPALGAIQPSMIVRVTSPSSTIYRLDAPLMQGEKVEEIQRALRDRGFNPGAIDGKFGKGTQQAVLDFQAKYGLVHDGEVGPSTEAALLGVNH